MAVIDEILAAENLPFIIIVLVVAIVSIVVALYLTKKIKEIYFNRQKLFK